MSKIVSYENGDGTISVMHPAPAMFDKDSRDRYNLHEQGRLDIAADDDAVLQFIIDKDVPKGKAYTILDKEDSNFHQMDRYFRSAWKVSKDKLDVDVVKAQEAHRKNLRLLRQPLLDKLDVDYQRADEQDNKALKQQIAAKKQALRDVTKLQLPVALDDLKAFIPEILK